MSIITRMRKQKAVWWARSAEPDHYGKFSFATPIEIACRWDECGSEYRDTKGQLAISDSTVYVDRVLKVGDKLKLGEQESDTPDDPTELEGVSEVQKFERIRKLRKEEYLNTAYMSDGKR